MAIASKEKCGEKASNLGGCRGERRKEKAERCRFSLVHGGGKRVEAGTVRRSATWRLNKGGTLCALFYYIFTAVESDSNCASSLVTFHLWRQPDPWNQKDKKGTKREPKLM